MYPSITLSEYFCRCFFFSPRDLCSSCFSTHIYAGSMLILAKHHLMIMHAIPFTSSRHGLRLEILATLPLPHDSKKTKRRSISKVDIARTC
ncbi:hypothetical protein NC651_002763 [Populus alba x Populus x berolinensis]|nr:hypothetical protein NC651_002763 [Populus alba x Populus x berolinensis]